MTPDKIQDQRNTDSRFAGGLAWTAGVKSATQLFTWASVAVVGRLLDKSAFGLTDVAGMFLGVTNVMAEFGIGTAVLHMPELDRKTLGQLHSFSLLLCSVIFGLSLLAVPGIAWFFKSPHVLFFAVANIAFLFTGIQAVPYGLLQRDMDYQKLAVLEAVATTSASAVTVIAALSGWGFWSILAGQHFGRIASTALLCYWKPVAPKWPRWGDIRKPVEMGRHVAVGRIAAAAYAQADGIVIGRSLGLSAQGIYGRAGNFAAAPSAKISELIMRAAAPLFANVMDDLDLIRRYYLITVEMLSLAVMPLMLGLAIVAPQAVQILGPQWGAAARPLQWLALFMIMRVLGVLAEQVLISQRLTRFTMRMNILSFMIMPLAFFMAARWKGTDGVAASWLLLSPVTVVPLLIIVLRRIHLSYREYAVALLPAIAGSAVMCLALFVLNSRLPESLPLAAHLALQVSTGGLVYAGFILLCFRARVLRYVNFITNLKKPKEAPSI